MVARNSVFAAPFSAVIRNGLTRRQPQPVKRPALSPIEVATTPGMQAGGDHAAAVEPACQGAGEQDVAQLGAPVGLERGPVLLADHRGGVEAGAAMRLRRDGDDARGGRGAQPVEQQIGQQERRQMVDRDGQLVAVLGQLRAGRDQPGIVDQHVEPLVPCQHRFGQLPHLGEAGEIGQRRLDRPGRRRVRRRCGGPVRGAPRRARP